MATLEEMQKVLFPSLKSPDNLIQACKNLVSEKRSTSPLRSVSEFNPSLPTARHRKKQFKTELANVLEMQSANVRSGELIEKVKTLVFKAKFHDKILMSIKESVGLPVTCKDTDILKKLK